tara:strand:+ start:56 stop:265 length:210 start_codon:yes stop_codon:yes gene_type:complete
MSEKDRLNKIIGELHQVLAKIDSLEKKSVILEKEIQKTRRNYKQIAMMFILALLFSIAIIVPVFFLVSW